MSFTTYRQHDAMDCGPACLRMIAKHYGKSYNLNTLRQRCQIQKNGVTLLGISEAAESIGLKTLAVRLSYQILVREVPLPCIIHWNQNHFVVLYEANSKFVWLADPAKGKVKLLRKEFEQKWLQSIEAEERSGIVLLLEPSATFTTTESGERGGKITSAKLLKHFARHRRLFIQLGTGTLIGMLLQVILPFLTQSVVDVGIVGKDMNFITLVLIGQVMIFIGSTVVEFIRSWILLHISTRINISLLTDFFIKVMRLPMSFFDVKLTGDLIQRMGDHSRIQTFLTSTLLNTSFSIINFMVFTFMVIAYSIQLFVIFLAGSVLYLGWILLFLNSRKKLDFQRFELSAANQNVTVEMIQGMQEIKLNNCEKQKRWGWERVQAKLFKLSIKSLLINQLQSTGALFINQGKNLLITFITAREVINGNLTLGGMMAVQYIVGQLSSPVQQIIQFIQSLQDARISLERINELHSMDDEEPLEHSFNYKLPEDRSIYMNGVHYKYPGYDHDYVLNNLTLKIPQGKITAIVGSSGSGKTTLLKLLLRFYQIDKGEIKIGGARSSQISPSFWRSKCGVVTQEGFIFSDTIAANIAVGQEMPDEERLREAIRVANIGEFIDSLPLGLQTKIGTQGNGMSQGQKQRILIARAVYKDPEYIFFDEATNALDANNEKVIMENLQHFFKGKTVVIVAHRLSTVKNADQIVVLDQGTISELGNHNELTAYKRKYYNLVKNQLEQGN